MRRLFYILLLVFAICAPGCKGKKEPLPQAGSPAPTFRIKTFDGRALALEDFRGRPLVINFWASWCPPCRREAGALRKGYEEFRGSVEFLGIAVQDKRENSLAFIEKYGLAFPNGPDEDDTIRVLYNVATIPRTFVIDRNGVISYVHNGAVTEEVLAREIKKVL